MRRIGDKRGLEMAITTVILIVLSIAVLTVLIVFFNSQTGFLSKWFRTNTGKSNVDAVVSSCNSLVSSESYYSYCCEEKEIIFDEENKEIMTCLEARDSNYIGDRIGELSCVSINCFDE